MSLQTNYLERKAREIIRALLNTKLHGTDGENSSTLETRKINVR